MPRQEVVGRLSANSLAALLPFFVMTVVACADLLAGTQAGLLSLLSLGPALAPVALGPARTVLTGGVAIILSMTLAAYNGIGFSMHAVVVCATIAGVTVAAVIASAARQRKERELVDVRAVADVAQRVDNSSDSAVVRQKILPEGSLRSLSAGLIVVCHASNLPRL